MGTPSPSDERRHTPDDQPLWNESYYLDWFTDDGALGGYLRIGFYPNLNRVWYWGCIVGEGRRLVMVTSHDAELPKDPQSLEVRADGLWADHSVDAPLEQFSVNLESFALELDDPANMYHDQRGTLVPFGFELDFTTDRAAYLWPPIQTRMEIPCKVHGQVMVGSDTIDIDAWGQRDHSWGGPRDWWMMGWMWSAGRLDDGTRFHAVGGFHEPGGGVSDGTFGIAYLLDPDASSSTEFDEFDEVRVSAAFGHEGLADSATLEFGGLTLDVEPIAWAPVLLVHDDGREARFPRALARFTARDGRRGHGWIEFNQPPTT